MLKADILRGKRHDPTACPLAHAIRRAYREASGRMNTVSVYWHGCVFKEAKQVASFPNIASSWVWEYDAWLDPEPISFALELKGDRHVAK